MDIKQFFEQAQIKRNNGEIEEAVRLYQNTRDQALISGDSWLASEALHMIGVALYQEEKYKEAKDYLDKAKSEFQKLNDQNLIGAVLRDLGMVLRKEGDFSKAKELLEESIACLKDNFGQLGISQVKLGMVYFEMGNLTQAETLIKQGLGNIQKSPERFFESIAWKNLGEVEIKAGKKEEGQKSLLKAQEILKSISTSDQNQSLKKEIEKMLRG